MRVYDTMYYVETPISVPARNKRMVMARAEDSNRRYTTVVPSMLTNVIRYADTSHPKENQQ